MKDYKLFMDVSGDIDGEFATENDIKFVPMDFIIDGEVQQYTADENGLDLKTFYDNIKSKKVIKTTQINPTFYEEFFRQYLASGQSVLYLCLSSGLSSTFNSAVIASENLKKEFPNAVFLPVDTLLATAPMGLLAERMVANKKSGMTIEENANDLNDIKHQISGYVMVDDLDTLKRGGRISSAVAFFGSVLGIKPIVELSEGTLSMMDKQKGVKRAIAKMSEIFRARHDFTISNTVYIVDAFEDENAIMLEQLVKEIDPSSLIKRVKLSPIIGAHLGSGAVAMTYFGKGQTK